MTYRGRTNCLVHWELSNHGWVKLNCDRAAKGNPDFASARGTIWNEHGESMGGFTSNLGIATTLVVDLWTVIHGLNLAWDKGFRRVQVDTYSKEVVRLIEKGVDVMHPHHSLVLRCQCFFIQD